jgi:hypothetical protein
MSTPKSLVQAELDRCWWWQREALIKLAMQEERRALDQRHKETMDALDRRRRELRQERKESDERTHENSLQKRMEDIDLESKEWVARRHQKVFTPNWWQQWWQEVKFATPYAIGTAAVTAVAGASYWARYTMIYIAFLHACDKHHQRYS